MQLNETIDQVERDLDIDRGILIETLEAALKTAAKRVFGEQRDIEAQYNEDTGEIELFLIITVANPGASLALGASAAMLGLEPEVEDGLNAASPDGDGVANPYLEITLEQARDQVDPNAEPGDELLFQIFYREEEKDKARDQDRRYGDLLSLRSTEKVFGRIAAQTAKQVIIQRIREAERQKIYEEYKDRKNELITGIVRRFEKGSIIVDLGRADAVLPASEQTRRESYRPGDRIQGYVKDVVRSARDAQVVLSRTDPGLVIKLFEQEVPEIYEGIVKIVAVAREPGVRSKVAVYSTDSDVDPVGACVGMRGSRVQSVVQELRGEKIDIVPYHSDPARFVCNAISPAQVSKVFLDDARVSMELIVPDDQLSLAIGRGGQNVRLAAQLTGWTLEIYSDSRLRQMMVEAKKQLLEHDGVTEGLIDTLFSLGYSKLDDISLAEVAELAQLPGFNEEKARLVVDAATAIISRPKAGDAPMTEEDLERQALMDVRGVGEKMAVNIHTAGYTKPIHLHFEDNPERLAKLAGIPVKKAQQVSAAATKWYSQQNYSEEAVDEHVEEREEWLEDMEDLFEVEDSEESVAAPEADESGSAPEVTESAETPEPDAPAASDDDSPAEV